MLNRKQSSWQPFCKPKGIDGTDSCLAERLDTLTSDMETGEPWDCLYEMPEANHSVYAEAITKTAQEVWQDRPDEEKSKEFPPLTGQKLTMNEQKQRDDALRASKNTYDQQYRAKIYPRYACELVACFCSPTDMQYIAEDFSDLDLNGWIHVFCRICTMAGAWWAWTTQPMLY